MKHSITFGTKNTWDDWHLIPTSRPIFSPPPVRTKSIDIPGMDGGLDLTEMLIGRPTYSNRTGSISFIIERYDLDWASIYSNILNYIHGKHLRAILKDDPKFFYEGRFNVSNWETGKSFSEITIDYNVGPFKKLVDNPENNWVIDPSVFNNGYVADYTNLTVSGTNSLTVKMMGLPLPIHPVFITTGSNVTVKLNGGSPVALPSGYNRKPTIAISSGINELVFSGTGKVTIICRGGFL